MNYPGEQSRIAKVTASGTPYIELTVFPDGVADTLIVCVPDTASEVLVICAHGHNGNQTTINSTRMIETRDRFIDNGWVVASPFAHGNSWGNDVCIADYVRVHGWAVTNLSTTKTLLHGQSMGALNLVNVLSRNAIPDVLGFVSIDGALNLATAFASGSYKSAIRTAYGIASDDSDYAALTAGHDGVLLSPNSFNGTRILLEASPADTSISKTNNADLFYSNVVGHPAIFQRLTGAGVHVDPGNYFPAEVEAFFLAALQPAPEPVQGTYSLALDMFLNDERKVYALVPRGDVWVPADPHRYRAD